MWTSLTPIISTVFTVQMTGIEGRGGDVLHLWRYVK